MNDRLYQPISALKGIGDAKTTSFAKLNINTIYELLTYYPRDYQSFEPVMEVCDLISGEVGVICVEIANNFFQKNIRGKVMVKVSAFDQSGEVDLVYFNIAYLRRVLTQGAKYVIRGMVRSNGRHIEFVQPQLFRPSEYEENRMRLQPVYATVKGIGSKTISKTIQTAFAFVSFIEDELNTSVKEKFNLQDYYTALYEIHFPKNIESLREARKRLVFEEFYHFFIGLNQMKIDNFECKSSFVMIETAECRRLIEQLPYSFTNAQKKVWKELSVNLQSGFVMNRLIQGDVGSGKTILAVLSMLMSTTNGYQSAFMAPTEVLAVQHFYTMNELTSKYNLPFKTLLLTGKMSAKDKREAYELIAEGKVNAVVGTHALFQEKVCFKNLALVITDEQHRFGVKQREQLMQKACNPHVLIMSATPIPRTLATVLYNDLDVSVLDELPQKRLPIKSCVVDTNYRKTAYNFIAQQINMGHQAYVICPQVAKNDDDFDDVALENVHDYAIKLKDEFPGEITIEILHGQMKSSEKTRIMDAFSKGFIDILVSTTVIEVGINVPNATVMIIENAERFGLAQLHQLRGRVGRGDSQSYCIFISTNKKENCMERLSILTKSNDGFYIANEDLRLRGPGDLLGIRQSGQVLFRIGDIYQDGELLLLAAEAAKTDWNT